VSARESDPDLETLLEYIRDARGFDFTGYKRPSLARRIAKRMSELSMESAREYLEHLEANPPEFVELFNAILINVTSFFRDPEAWRYLADEVLPRILSTKQAGEPIRVWSAGCASGEEPYSLAILLAEALEPSDFRQRVKIYATDVDEEALAQGRRGTYEAKALENIPPESVVRWFKQEGEHATLASEIRHSLVFGRQDLVQDPPISRVDLLVCRNTLMYFTSETQSRIVARFHFALEETGFLFLGRSEMLFSGRHLFTPDSTHFRVFTKLPETEPPLQRSRVEEGKMDRSLRDRLHEEAVDSTRAAQIVVDADGLVVMVNEQARRTFGLDRRDVGRALRDLEVSYRPVDLRSAIDRVIAEKRAVDLEGIERQLPDGGTQVLDLNIAPVRGDAGAAIGMIVTFTDSTHEVQLRTELERARQELETAYEELQATNEEVETTNEELQSTVEELETTNEELQSTNEELETMNEELQSTNEELETVNTELRQRGEDLNHANSLLKSILGGLRVGVAVIDRDLRVMVWNERAEDLWGLRADEVRDRHFMNLDIGLPVDQLRQPLRACLTGESPQERVVLDARDRRGRAIRCEVNCTPLLNPEREIRGAIVFMETGDERRAL
jgi:two-component system, chemotaxis family, CheB/CheR fusion protein